MIHKQIPQEMMKEYQKLDIPFNEFNDFFDKYVNGKRQGNGIVSRYLGYANDVTIFWLTDEEYPFAYVFPKSFDSEFRYGYFFYVRNANGS